MKQLSTTMLVAVLFCLLNSLTTHVLFAHSNDSELSEFTMNVSQPSMSICATPGSGHVITYGFDINYTNGFNGAIDFSTFGLPNGVIATFSENPVTTPGFHAVSIFNAENLSPGTYNFDILGTPQHPNNEGTTQFSTLTIQVEAGSPATTNLVSPTNGATNLAVDIALEWTAAIDATSYDIELGTDNTFSGFNEFETYGYQGTQTNISLTEGTTYYWRVRPFNSCGTPGWSTVHSFTTSSNNASDDFNLIFYNDAETHCAGTTAEYQFYAEFLGNFSEDVQLNILSTPENPQVYYSQNPINSTGNYSVFIETFTLPSGQYQYHLEATSPTLNKLYILTLNISSSAVSTPTLFNPAEGDFVEYNGVFFDWDDSFGAISYDLQISQGDYDFTTLEYNLTGISSSDYFLSLTNNSFYTWRVRATSECGFTGNWTNAQSFNTTNYSGGPNFSITPVNTYEITCGSDVTYFFNISYNESFNESINLSFMGAPSQDYTFSTNPITTEGEYSVTFHNTFLLPAGSYNFELESTSTTTSYLRELELFVQNIPPSAPSLIQPFDGETELQDPISIEWQNNNSTVNYYYNLEIATDPNFNNIAISDYNTPFTSTSVGALSNTTYYWRVNTVDYCGNTSNWSPTYSYTSASFDQSPNNNEVCSYIPIFCGETWTGTTQYGTHDNPNNIFDACSGYLGGAPNVFYLFNGTGDEVTASLCNSNYDTRMEVYCMSNDNCSEGSSYPTFTCITGNDDFGTCGGGSEVTFATTSGVNYMIMIHGFGENSGVYELVLTCNSGGCTQPNNNDCQPTGQVCGFEGTAQIINVDSNIPCTLTSGTTSCATTGTPASCSFSSQVQDVWYQLNTGPTGTIIMALEATGNTPATQLHYAIYSSCGGNELYCATPTSVDIVDKIEGLPAESDVFLQIWSTAQTAGDFELCAIYENTAAVNFYMGDVCGNSGTTVSVPFTVEDFTNISGMQFSIHLGSGVGTIQGVSNFGLASLSASNFNINSNGYEAQVVWAANNSTGETLSNFTTLFTLDITLNGNSGSTSVVYVNGTPTPIYIGQGSNADEAPYQFRQGSVCITNDFSISGNFTTPQSKSVNEVNISTSSQGDLYTGMQSYYTISGIQNGENVTITPSKTESSVTGINVVDRIIVLRHLLNQESFTSPYQYIAADVNTNQSVNVQDVFLMKRATLDGTPFPNNKYWMFVDAHYQFSNSNDPFPFPESKIYSSMSSDVTDGDFMAIKLGDMNESSVAQNLQTTDLTKNNRPPITVQTDNATGSPNEMVIVPVRVNGFNDVIGFEFALEWDHTKLEYESVQNFAFSSLNNDDFGITDGKIMVSWDNNLAMENVDANQPLFTVTFKIPTSATKTTTPLNFGTEKCFLFNNDPTNCTADVTATGSQIDIENATALAVDVSDFTAQLTKQSAVRLAWTAENEVNLSHFEILASTDTQDWTNIGQVTANQAINYYFLDYKPAFGKNFYRLKMVDEDGTSRLSPIRIVELTEQQQDAIQVTNPVQERIDISIQTRTERDELVRIYDAQGRLVQQSTFTLRSGSNNLSINATELATGIYFLQLGDNNTPYKVVKLSK